MVALTESPVESADFSWLEGVGRPVAERADYGAVVLDARLRHTLLPKLVSGELCIPDMDTLFGRVSG